MPKYNQNEIGNLGIAPALVYAIYLAATALVSAGYSYYTSLQEARRQQREQRYLNELELSQLAELFVQKYPEISYSEWLDYVRATNKIYTPINNAPNGGQPKLETSYWTYLAIFVLVLMVMKK